MKVVTSHRVIAIGITIIIKRIVEKAIVIGTAPVKGESKAASVVPVSEMVTEIPPVVRAHCVGGAVIRAVVTIRMPAAVTAVYIIGVIDSTVTVIP